MGLSHLDISAFRNLISVTLEPAVQGFNCIHGNNGSGKTSLLEAIYYLSLGRSFRSSQAERVIGHSANKLSIFGHMEAASDQIVPVGLERYVDGKIKLRVDGKDVLSITELARLIPVQLIDSYCHSLLDSGPGFRRKYLDFGLFYSERDFLRLWRQFERALKQRNAALRGQISRRELAIWTRELVETAIQLDQKRCEYVERLVPPLANILTELLPIFDLKITYQSGWDCSSHYSEVLLKTIEKDSQLGYTQFGPHKADLRIKINDIPAKDILSRGQQKLFVCAMILARGALLRSYANKVPIYLVDDLPSELDAVSRSNLIVLLSRQKAQVFVTAIEDGMWGDTFMGPMKMFHVEHGCVSEVNTSGVIKSEYSS